MIDRVGDQCCGCGVCASSCTMNCISMAANEEGFLYPVIDYSKCINCGLCDMKCPVLNRISFEDVNRCFVVRNLDTNVLAKSAAGGFFSALVSVNYNEECYFCGACFDENWSIVHKLTNKLEDLNHMRGSKYVQSSLSGCFSLIKDCLLKKKKVIFSGTPCQVQAVKKYLGSLAHSELLITVDVVCKGVGSPGLWDKYLEYQKSKYNSNINYINFREKVNGYHSSNMVLKFDNGKQSSRSKTDLFMRAYVNELCTRNSCYNCEFKGVNRCSDFTIFDAWHAAELLGIDDDDKGYTTVIAHNTKAIEQIQQMNGVLDIKETDIEMAIKLDGSMVNNQPHKNTKQKDYLTTSIAEGINISTEKYNTITVKEVLIEKVKPILYKIGLLQKVKQFRRKK